MGVNCGEKGNKLKLGFSTEVCTLENAALVIKHMLCIQFLYRNRYYCSQVNQGLEYCYFPSVMLHLTECWRD